MFDVPNEITCQILTEAIRDRGIRRAQRLRLVSKTWKAWVDEIQIVLGEFVDRGFPFHRAPFWPQYLAHLALRPQQTGASPTLRIVRQAAERVAEYMHPRACSDAVVRELIVEICTMGELFPAWHCALRRTLRGQPDPVKPGRSWPSHAPEGFIYNEQDRYNHFLLATAAAANQAALIEETLQSMQGTPAVQQRICNFALGTAAYKGHNGIVSMLLDVYPKPHSRGPGAIVMKYASKANNLSTLELITDLDESDPISPAMEAIVETSSLEIYRKLYTLAKRGLVEGEGPYTTYLESIAKHMVLMAGRGAVPVLEHLLHLEIPGRAYWDLPPRNSARPDLLLAAVRAGQLETARWLLETREEYCGVTGKVLDAAAACGSYAVMEILLDYSGEIGYVQSNALVIAVTREHEDMAATLLAREHYDQQDVDLAFEKACEMGLESMVELLSCYRA